MKLSKFLLLAGFLSAAFVVQGQNLQPSQLRNLKRQVTTDKNDSLQIPVLSKNNQQVRKAYVADLLPYKIWSGTISQSGTSAPSSVVFQNTLGDDITFARTGVGIYTATCTGAYAISVTQVFTGVGNDGTAVPVILAAVRTSDNVITLRSSQDGVLADAILTNIPLEIRVWRVTIE